MHSHTLACISYYCSHAQSIFLINTTTQISTQKNSYTHAHTHTYTHTHMFHLRLADAGLNNGLEGGGGDSQRQKYLNPQQYLSQHRSPFQLPHQASLNAGQRAAPSHGIGSNASAGSVPAPAPAPGVGLAPGQGGEMGGGGYGARQQQPSLASRTHRSQVRSVYACVHVCVEWPLSIGGAPCSLHSEG